jgi:membrane associated rhomboid family serine protease
MSLRVALRDRRVLLATAGWTILNVVFAWGASGLTDGASIAWEAHLGGFYFGLLTYGLFDRPPDVSDIAAPAE